MKKIKENIAYKELKTFEHFKTDTCMIDEFLKMEMV